MDQNCSDARRLFHAVMKSIVMLDEKIRFTYPTDKDIEWIRAQVTQLYALKKIMEEYYTTLQSCDVSQLALQRMRLDMDITFASIGDAEKIQDWYQALLDETEFFELSV